MRVLRVLSRADALHDLSSDGVIVGSGAASDNAYRVNASRLVLATEASLPSSLGAR